MLCVMQEGEGTLTLAAAMFKATPKQALPGKQWRVEVDLRFRCACWPPRLQGWCRHGASSGWWDVAASS